jgi:hypothetical protein
MPLFRNTLPFFSPSVGCVSVLLLFSACNAAQAGTGNLGVSTFGFIPMGRLFTPDYGVVAGTINGVTLNLNYDGTNTAICDAQTPGGGLLNVDLRLSGVGSFPGNNDGPENAQFQFVSDLRSTPVSLCQNSGNGNSNGGGGPLGGNGNGNGGGNPNDGGMPATPEPSSFYLSAVAAGLMSWMLRRRGLRQR